MNNEEMITITKKEYEKLIEDKKFLTILENCGVDNWNFYETAVEIFNEE